jgi:hypothetical protein
MILRAIETQWTPFIDALCSRDDVETAGVILAEKLEGANVLLARRMVEIPESGYLIRQRDQLRIDPVTINRVVRPARDLGLSIITIHTHPNTEQPWFSIADDQGDTRLMPSFLNQTPGPHGSLVVAGATGITAGRVWSDNSEKLDLQTRVVGKSLRLHSGGMMPANGLWFDRQRLALGDTGQTILRNLHIVVVGLGGTGSVVAVQLAHLGVGHITLIDGDRVEQSNVSRILGATTGDVGHAWKVEVAARYIERLGLGTQIRCLRGHLGTEISSSLIEHCDVAFSCVDKHLPRALLNRLSYDKAIPLIDMGSAFRVNGCGQITDGVGRVVIVGPGRPCLACWGHIDPDRMRVEALSTADRAQEIADGYIQGAEVAQPSVIAFNTTIAGAAVVEFLRLATNFAGTDDPPIRLNFDFEVGTVRRNRLPQETDCKICLQGSKTR